MKELQIKPRLKVHLLKGKTITALQALKRYGTIRLAVYINRLRNDGHKIHCEMITEKGKTFGKYSLIK